MHTDNKRGFLTLFVGFITFLLMLNDIGEFVFGWPDHEFSVDAKQGSFMKINVGLVSSPSTCLFLSSTAAASRAPRRRSAFAATALKEHKDALRAPGRKNARLFLFGGAANLHITTLGHGYSSHEHVDHKLMNLSHVITEFFFGPYFPDITQPLDNSLEYFLHVVPTTYIAPRSAPLHTNQYSVTHYTRVLSGTPGIFFKFDLDPMSLTIHQRTSTFLQLVIRRLFSSGRGGVDMVAGALDAGEAARIAPIPHSLVRSLHCVPLFTYPPLPCPLVRSLANPLLPVSRCVGVIGGVFVCMGYALKVTTAAVSALVDNSADEIPPAVASASALRTKFSGASLTKRARPFSGRLVPQGNGWVMESAPGSPVPYGGASSPYSGTPVSSTFPPPSPFSPASPFPGSPSGFPGSQPGTPGTGYGPPPMSARSSSGLGPGGHPRTPAGSVGNAAAMGIQPPGTPQYGIFPPTPGPAQTGFNVPPPPAGNKRLSMNGSPGAEKKKDD
ncbi:endoplasmic reticulum vesicle transporter-domain-containing protein [Mycena galopus ATCC 62051]|nr:endoplasmic reticulum vesicle transporter-domain-containing protein [Mycena galopus ATCC 62051]